MPDPLYAKVVALCDKNNSTVSETTREMWRALLKDEERHDATYGVLETPERKKL